MSVLDDLAFYVQHAVQDEGYEALALRCGIVLETTGKGNKNFVHRAAHPNEQHSDTRCYTPILSENLVKLLDGLGLTVAPKDMDHLNVAQICMQIWQLKCSRDARTMAMDGVHRAYTMPE